MQRMTPPQPSAAYRVFPAGDGGGGKRVAVFLEPGPAEAGGQSGNNSERQARAAGAGTPLSVFVEPLPDGAVRVDSFTPTAHKGSSDSGAVAALAFLQAHQGLPDALDVQSAGGESVSAQLCGGEWLLLQGDVSVTPLEGDRALSPAGLGGARAWVASAGRANLAVQVDSLAALEAFMPDPARIEALNAATGTTGLIVFTPGGPEGADRRADVSFRAFGPLRGFLEDAASSNMFACLVGVLCAAELLSPDINVLRGAQRRPGQPARLTAQFTPMPGGAAGVWVGGAAWREEV